MLLCFACSRVKSVLQRRLSERWAGLPSPFAEPLCPLECPLGDSPRPQDHHLHPQLWWRRLASGDSVDTGLASWPRFPLAAPCGARDPMWENLRAGKMEAAPGAGHRDSGMTSD